MNKLELKFTSLDKACPLMDCNSKEWYDSFESLLLFCVSWFTLCAS